MEVPLLLLVLSVWIITLVFILSLFYFFVFIPLLPLFPWLSLPVFRRHSAYSPVPFTEEEKEREKHLPHPHFPSPSSSSSSSLLYRLFAFNWIRRFSPVSQLLIRLFLFFLLLSLLSRIYRACLEQKLHLLHFTGVVLSTWLFQSHRPLCPPLPPHFPSSSPPLAVVFTSGSVEGLALAQPAIHSVLECTSLRPFFIWSHPSPLPPTSYFLTTPGLTTIHEYEGTEALYNGHPSAEWRMGEREVGIVTRYELPRLMNASEVGKYVFYSDTDVLFLREYDWTKLIHTFFPSSLSSSSSSSSSASSSIIPIAMAVDSDAWDLRPNSGFMLINMERWAHHLPSFRSFLMSEEGHRYWKEESWDQGAAIRFNNAIGGAAGSVGGGGPGEVALFPLTLNWKPYWGYRAVLYGAVAILHFHGGSKYESVRRWLVTNEEPELQHYHTRSPFEAEARALALLDYFVQRSNGETDRIIFE